MFVKKLAKTRLWLFYSEFLCVLYISHYAIFAVDMLNARIRLHVLILAWPNDSSILRDAFLFAVVVRTGTLAGCGLQPAACMQPDYIDASCKACRCITLVTGTVSCPFPIDLEKNLSLNKKNG